MPTCGVCFCMAQVNDLELTLSQAQIRGRPVATPLTIGELALQADVAATTLRFYERIGLIQSPARVGGQRRYDDSIRARLDVIRLCKAAGFTLDETQLLFADDVPRRPAGRALPKTARAESDARPPIL